MVLLLQGCWLGLSKHALLVCVPLSESVPHGLCIYACVDTEKASNVIG